MVALQRAYHFRPSDSTPCVVRAGRRANPHTFLKRIPPFSLDQICTQQFRVLKQQKETQGLDVCGCVDLNPDTQNSRHTLAHNVRRHTSDHSQLSSPVSFLSKEWTLETHFAAHRHTPSILRTRLFHLSTEGASTPGYGHQQPTSILESQACMGRLPDHSSNYHGRIKGTLRPLHQCLQPTTQADVKLAETLARTRRDKACLLATFVAVAVGRRTWPRSCSLLHHPVKSSYIFRLHVTLQGLQDA